MAKDSKDPKEIWLQAVRAQKPIRRLPNHQKITIMKPLVQGGKESCQSTKNSRFAD